MVDIRDDNDIRMDKVINQLVGGSIPLLGSLGHIAQPEERRTLNPQVLGSVPSVLTWDRSIMGLRGLCKPDMRVRFPPAPMDG